MIALPTTSNGLQQRHCCPRSRLSSLHHVDVPALVEQDSQALAVFQLSPSTSISPEAPAFGENPLEPLSPDYGRRSLNRDFLVRAIRSFGLAAFAPLCQRNPCSVLAVRCEYTVKSSEGVVELIEFNVSWCFDPAKPCGRPSTAHTDATVEQHTDEFFDHTCIVAPCSAMDFIRSLVYEPRRP